MHPLQEEHDQQEVGEGTEDNKQSVFRVRIFLKVVKVTLEGILNRILHAFDVGQGHGRHEENGDEDNQGQRGHNEFHLPYAGWTRFLEVLGACCDEGLSSLDGVLHFFMDIVVVLGLVRP